MLKIYISFRVGFAIMTTIVVMEPTKENSVIPNIKHVLHKNLPAKTLSAFAISTGVMVKMIAVIIQMRLIVRRTTSLAPLDNLLAPMANVLIITWFVIKWLTVWMNLTSQLIVM